MSKEGHSKQDFYTALFMWLFWVGIFGLLVWVFKILIAPPQPPEWSAGVMGGAVWAYVTAKVAGIMQETFNDFVAELKARNNSNER